MHGGFTKLFNSILHSTVWQEDLATKVVWVTMLAMADKDGAVTASIPGLARAAGVGVSDCEKALGVFLAPDPYSRTKDHDGKRIIAIDGGWLLINYTKYREIADLEARREYLRVKQSEFRKRKHLSTNVNNVNKNKHIAESREQRAEADNIKTKPENASSDDEVADASKQKAVDNSAESEAQDKTTPWWSWVLCHRELGLADPAQDGPDTKAAKTLGGGKDRSGKFVPGIIRDREELKRIYKAFLSDKNSYAAKRGHPLRLLPGCINIYRDPTHAQPVEQTGDGWKPSKGFKEYREIFGVPETPAEGQS